MREHPLLCTGPVVRAILAGLQTQDRRPIRPQPVVYRISPDIRGLTWKGMNLGSLTRDERGSIAEKSLSRLAPYQIGDHFWVRETWYEFADGRVTYRADEEPINGVFAYRSWRPSIHMPRWASRITLKVTRVRAERIKDISFDDMVAEGIQYPVYCQGHRGLRLTGDYPPCDYLKGQFKDGKFQGDERMWLWAHFASMWDSLYAKRGYGTEVNPFCWVYDFKRLERSEHE